MLRIAAARRNASQFLLVHEPFAKMALRRHTMTSISTTISPSIITFSVDQMYSSQILQRECVEGGSSSESSVSASVVAALGALLVTSFTGMMGMSNNDRVISMAEALPTTTDVHDKHKIINWSGTHTVEVSTTNYHEPETQDELTRLVTTAYQTNSHIRPVGSALSPNGLSFDSRGMVCLSNLDRIIDVDTKNMTVTVEAGARVSTVLDALRPHGLTLPNLASIAEQQVGGFVSAGAHGTGALIPPVDEFVTSLTLVTPSRLGVVKMTEASHGEVFRLARLGLGGLGILSEVTMRVIPAHRLVEQTSVITRAEAKSRLPTLLKRHKHIRYMWIPYEDAVVVVTNDPEDSLPLAMEGGVVVSDGKGGKKKVMTMEDVTPKFTRDEQLAPLRNLLHKLLANLSSSSSLPLLDNDTINRMGFADLRDALLAYGNMLDPDHIKRVNKAEAEFWKMAQGIDIAPSDQKLNFDCGGQQWVYEVCFPCGTYGMPNSNSIDLVEELLTKIEKSGIAAPAPIEQRWTSASKSPLSPAYANSLAANARGLLSDHGAITGARHRNFDSYDTTNALFSWVGVIMYLPSEDLDPTGYRREFITKSFKDGYCKMVQEVGQRYGAMCHWAKLELDKEEEEEEEDEVVKGVSNRIGPKVVGAYNMARAMFDPNGLLSNSLIDRIFGPSSSNK